MYFQKNITTIITAIFFSFSAFSEDGKTLFRGNCAACHFIGKGRLIGPDLKDVHTRYEEPTLIKWIKNASQLIKEGDPKAVALYNEYNKVMMTDFSFLSEEQIKNIITYIKEESVAPSAEAPAPISDSEQINSVADKSSGISFSAGEYILLSFVFLMLIVIILLARTIKKLTDQLGDYYAGSSSFF